MGQIDFKTMRVSTGIRILILGLMFAFSTNQVLSDTPRIINGTAAQVGQFPYVICVKRPLGRCCTGSLITAEKVITACHCFKPNEENCEINCNFGVGIAGDVYKDENELTANSRQERKLVKLVKHPKYSGGREYDMAILTTETPFELNEFVAVIPLTETNLDVDQKCISVGYGRQDLDSSKRVETDLAWFECTVKEIISDKLIKTYSPSQSVFKGDSGSPLVDNFEDPKIHGVLYGHGSTGAVYGLITSAKKWIIKNSESDSSEKQRQIRSNGSPLNIISIWVFFMPSVIHCGKQIRI